MEGFVISRFLVSMVHVHRLQWFFLVDTSVRSPWLFFFLWISKKCIYGIKVSPKHALISKNALISKKNLTDLLQHQCGCGTLKVDGNDYCMCLSQTQNKNNLWQCLDPVSECTSCTHASVLWDDLLWCTVKIWTHTCTGKVMYKHIHLVTVRPVFR